MKENILPVFQPSIPDTLDVWMEAYFRLDVSTSVRSQREQRRDLHLFLNFMQEEEGRLERARWIPRLSGAFIDYLQSVHHEDGTRGRIRDRSIMFKSVASYSDKPLSMVMVHHDHILT
ncbi:MAG: hypothetical protein GWP10_07880, partial [Nitrospiraceae bacterium]|nr:hypothetical protein [Nitrospiraceae bacterium]